MLPPLAVLSVKRLRLVAANDFVLQLAGNPKLEWSKYIVTEVNFYTIISPPAPTALNALWFISAVYLGFQGAL